MATPARRRGRDTKVFYTPADDSGNLITADRTELTGKLRGFDGLQGWGTSADQIRFGGGGGLTGSIPSGYKRVSPSMAIDDNDVSRPLFFGAGGRQGQLEVAAENSTESGKKKQTVLVNIINYRHAAPERQQRRFFIQFGATSGITDGTF